MSNRKVSKIIPATAIKLLSLKQYGQLSKLTVSIEKINEQGPTIISDDYNIHNFVNVRFQASKKGEEEYEDEYESGYSYGHFQISWKYGIAIQKHITAKDLRVLLKIACKDTKFRKENVDCVEVEGWSTWIPMGSTIKESFEVDLEITLSKIQSIINTKLYDDDTFTDFTLSGEGGSVAVHKAHLAAHSDTFMTMFHGQWKETNQNRIELKGFTLKTINHLKQYIYLGTLPQNNEDLRALLLLATQYLIDSLKTECSMKLLQTITPENLDSLVEFCIENEISELLRTIQETTPENVLATGYAIRIKKRLAPANEVVGNDKDTKKKSRKK